MWHYTLFVISSQGAVSCTLHCNVQQQKVVIFNHTSFTKYNNKMEIVISTWQKKYTVCCLCKLHCCKKKAIQSIPNGLKPRPFELPDMAENWLDLQMKLHELLVWDDICYVAARGTHRLVQMTEWWTSEKSFEISGDSGAVDISRSDCSTIFLSRADLLNPPQQCTHLPSFTFRVKFHWQAVTISWWSKLQSVGSIATDWYEERAVCGAWMNLEMEGKGTFECNAMQNAKAK